LLFVSWGVSLRAKFLPQDFPHLREINLDWGVLVFTLVASLLTGFLFILAPALEVSKTDVHASLKESTRGAAGG